MMEEKLKQSHDTTKMFGGKDMLLSCDFLQMKTFGTAICTSLCATVTTNYFNFNRLTSEFEVFHIKEQVRQNCELRKRFLKKFRALLESCPSGASYTIKEKKELKIVDDETIHVVTSEFADSDMENKIEGESS